MLRESRTVFSIKMKLNLQENGFKNVGLLIKPNKPKNQFTTLKITKKKSAKAF